MDDAAQFSPIPSTCANHESGNLSANPVITRTMKLVSRTRCCQRWFTVMRVMIGFCIRRRATALLPPDDGVVQEHRANHEQNQGNVNPPHPAHRNRADVSRARAILKMHRRARELLRHAFVALAACGIQVRAIDRRARIARRQNVVHAVATRAVGRHHRPAFRSQAVIAVKIARDAVAWNAELLRKPHAFMAARADITRYVLLRDRRVGIGMRLDGVNPVAVGARGRHCIAPRQRLPVNAHVECVRNVRVTLAASCRHIELRDRRFGIVGRQNLVRSMAIRAHRSILRPVCHCAAVHARLVRNERLRALPVRLHQKLLPVAAAAGGRDVGVVDRRAGSARTHDFMRVAVAVFDSVLLRSGRVCRPWRGCRGTTPPVRRHGTGCSSLFRVASHAPGSLRPNGNQRSETSCRAPSA